MIESTINREIIYLTDSLDLNRDGTLLMKMWRWYGCKDRVTVFINTVFYRFLKYKTHWIDVILIE